jgi:hypothetical protein
MTDDDAPEGASRLDVDALVAQLRDRVDERRRQGAYPPGLEEDLADHLRRALLERAEPWVEPDLQSPLQQIQRALPLSQARIPLESSVPGGEVLHRAVGKVVTRQTHGALQQVQGFAQPVRELLERIVLAVENLSQEVHVEIPRHLDAIYERQAALERLLAAVADGAPDNRPPAAPGDG